MGERFIEADLERIVKNDLLEKLRLLVDVDDRLYAAAAASEGTEENLRFRLEQIEKRMKQMAKIVAKAPFARQNRATVPEGRAIP